MLVPPDNLSERSRSDTCDIRDLISILSLGPFYGVTLFHHSRTEQITTESIRNPWLRRRW